MPGRTSFLIIASRRSRSVMRLPQPSSCWPTMVGSCGLLCFVARAVRSGVSLAMGMGLSLPGLALKAFCSCCCWSVGQPWRVKVMRPSEATQRYTDEAKSSGEEQSSSAVTAARGNPCMRASLALGHQTSACLCMPACSRSLRKRRAVISSRASRCKRLFSPAFRRVQSRRAVLLLRLSVPPGLVEIHHGLTQ